MKANLFKIECITNLHVGSGDVNFNIVDKEVEKDPVTEYPVIHASGVKGAFRVYCEEKKMDERKINYIFGDKGDKTKGNPAAYRFFDAKFISRPLRVGGNASCAYIPVTTVQAINDFLKLTSAFGCNSFDVDSISVNFDGEFAVSSDDIKDIEGITNLTALNADPKIMNALKMILGENFAIAKDLKKFDLPVIARNKLDNGKSENLWYEEFVPRTSVFGLIVLTPGDHFEIEIKSPVQFGGNATVGYGYCNVAEF